jgi:magnesium transporter
MLQENDTVGMQTFCETLHPATVAETLAEEFEVEQVWRFLQHTSIRNQAAIFEYFPITWQVKMVEGTGRPHMARLIEQMSHDDRVDLLRRLMPRVAEGLLRLVDEADRRDIATLVKFAENTAGALMTTDYAWLPEHITALEALDRLRLQAPDRETIYYVYVLNDQRKLLGVVSLRDLILAPRHAVIRDLMEKEVIAVPATEDREQVAQTMARYDLLAIPVVDDDKRLVGIVTHDDVIDVVVQEATEDVHRMGAVGPLEENYLQANFVTVWRNRAFWMACFFVAELFTIQALGYFEEEISRLVVLSLFIPLCISTGGNSGSQAATLITRALALGQVAVSDWLRVLRHELFMGLALGLTLGAIGFVGVSIMTGGRHETEWWKLALVIAQAVTGICLWGTLVGSLLPLVFKRLGIDPGIASTPFVATFVDVTGILIYFSIAKVYLL